MSDWYWVRNGNSTVDTDELARAGANAGLALEAVEAALGGLAAPGWHPVSTGWQLIGRLMRGTLQWSDHVQQVSHLDALIGDALDDVRCALASLSQLVSDYARWMGTTALIYAAAEADASGYVSACSTLATLGCAIPGGSLVGLSAVGGLPTYIRSMAQGGGSHSSPGSSLAPTALIVAEQQIAGIGNTQAAASVAAQWWKRVGALTWGSTSGVVVVGASGAAWGASTKDGSISIRPRESWPQGWSVESHPATLAAEKAADAHRILGMAGPSTILSVAATQGGRAAKVGVSSTPITAAQLLGRVQMSRTDPSTGEVQILRHTTPGAVGTEGSSGVEGTASTAPVKRSWTVVVRGTQTWTPGSSNPQDMLSNLQEVAGEVSDQTVSVRVAMNLAGIRPGEAVEFVGHSQGGAVALALASREDVRTQFDIVSVLTAGGPVGLSGPAGTRVLALENLADIVPALDGRPSLATSGHQVVYFDAEGVNSPVPGAHSIETYVAAADGLHQAADGDPLLRSVADWEAQRINALGLNERTETMPMFFSTRRIRGNLD